MKLYIASSWKNENAVRTLAEVLRAKGHEVDAFCDKSTGRYVFHWSEFVEREDDLKEYDAKSFMDDPRVQRAFLEDKNWIDWAEGVVLLVPSGRSAHLEAGYAVGHGKPLWIYGALPKGEFDVMYGFAKNIYRIDDLDGLLFGIRFDEAGQRLMKARAKA